jgi:ankyrin repeat protein
MKLLLSKGVDVESESDAGTPLVWAAGHGNQDAVKLLLQHNAKVPYLLHVVYSMNLSFLLFFQNILSTYSV